MTKTKKEYRDEIEKLLRASHWRDEGPHGATINAVLRRVEKIMLLPAQRVYLHPVRKVG